MVDYEQEFGELALVIGDFHIPMRAVDIPEAFKELLVPNKVQNVICTGNFGCRETIDWLKSLSSNTFFVKGDYDDLPSVPEFKAFTIGSFKVGLIHGHQVIPWGDEESLYNIIRENDVDILISGHTHEARVSKLDGKYYINPGSATGAYSPLQMDVEPSFLLLEFKETSVIVYVYKFSKGEVKIDKTVLNKSK